MDYIKFSITREDCGHRGSQTSCYSVPHTREGMDELWRIINVYDGGARFKPYSINMGNLPLSYLFL